MIANFVCTLSSPLSTFGVAKAVARPVIAEGALAVAVALCTPSPIHRAAVVAVCTPLTMLPLDLFH